MINLFYKRLLTVLVPLGISVFVLLYFIATLLYPGGSSINKTADGFSWLHNYWCNLLNPIAINGDVNKAQPLALLALIILCVTLLYFWFQFTKQFQTTKVFQLIIRGSSSIALFVSLFLATKINHDLITTVAGSLGAITLIASVYVLYQNKLNALANYGVFNVLAMLFNQLLYRDAHWIYYLPLVQKLTFASVLIWVLLVSIDKQKRYVS